MVTITKQEHIRLIHQANYWQAQHGKAKEKIAQLEQEKLCQDGKIKDLQNRLFGKHSEKSNRPGPSEKDKPEGPPKRPRGQQSNSAGHGRTKRPDLAIADVTLDLAEDEKKCAQCELPHIANPALDEVSEMIEVEVKAHTRRYYRPAYQPHPGCCCEGTSAISNYSKSSPGYFSELHRTPASLPAAGCGSLLSLDKGTTLERSCHGGGTPGKGTRAVCLRP